MCFDVMRTVLVAWWVALCVGCAPHGPPEVRTTGRAAAPGIPAPLSPLDDALPVPELGEPAGGLDLEDLVRKKVAWELQTDLAGLDAADATQWKTVFRQMAADPRWRVSRWGDTTVAFARRLSGGRWVVPRTGYHDEDGHKWRVAVRFGPWSPQQPWAASSRVQHVPTAVKALSVVGFIEGDRFERGCWSSAVAVDALRVGLDVYECAPVDVRRVTERAVADVPAYVAGAVAEGSQVADLGYSGTWLPPDEPSRGSDAIELRSPEPGLLEVSGRLNPGAVGWSWVRILRDGAPWEERAIGAGTLEVIGWSATSTERFYFDSVFPVPPGPGFAGQAELWFLPLDSQKARRLALFAVQVPERLPPPGG